MPSYFNGAFDPHRFGDGQRGNRKAKDRFIEISGMQYAGGQFFYEGTR